MRMTHFFKYAGRLKANYLPCGLALLSVAILAANTTAHAARPMIVDDARIVDPKACQVESWAKKKSDSTELWALPACNFTGNLELTMGGASTREGGRASTTDIVMQGKTLLKTLETNGWGIGLAAGTVRRPVAETRDWYSYMLNSFSFLDDVLIVHTNVGVYREGETFRNLKTGGVGTEIRVAPQTWLIAETFGQGEDRPFHQVGVRHWLVPNHVQIDATYGNRNGGGMGERWFTVGLRLISLPFLQ